MVLFRIIRNSGLTDYIDFDLTRIFHVCFNQELPSRELLCLPEWHKNY